MSQNKSDPEFRKCKGYRGFSASRDGRIRHFGLLITKSTHTPNKFGILVGSKRVTAADLVRAAGWESLANASE